MHLQLCEEAKGLMKSKNHDYTAGGGVFDNFRNAEVLGVPGELGLLVRVMDKLLRLKTFVTQGTLANGAESAKDSILDIINYMVILAGMLEEKGGKKPDGYVGLADYNQLKNYGGND
jgi:hypothetical protein